jgi:allantoate deiminase
MNPGDHVSAERLAGRLEELAGIGGGPDGSVTRLGLTPEEQRARDLVRSWLEPLGFEMREDDALNLFGRRGHGPRILVGSHLDTVPAGGRYDGALGVVVAVEAAQALHAAGLQEPIEVVAWQGEEGARFGTGLFGSAASFGLLPAAAWDLKDANGTVARTAAAELLGRAPNPEAPLLDLAEIGALIEVHIEQGPELERLGVPLGVVTRIVGISHGSVTIEGEADHAGATSMDVRKDALTAAAECILAVELLTRTSRGAAVATVGQIDVAPGAQNVIPGRCRFSLDIRSARDETRHGVVRMIERNVAEVCSRRGIAGSVRIHDEVPAAAMAEDVVSALEEGSRAVGIEAPRLESRAGHDAQNAAKSGVPTGMLFVRSTGGSHNPREHAEPEDAALAVRALLVALQRLSPQG